MVWCYLSFPFFLHKCQKYPTLTAIKIWSSDLIFLSRWVNDWTKLTSGHPNSITQSLFLTSIRKHFTMPPLVSQQNEIWETRTEIPYVWWCITTLILVVTCYQYGISVCISQMSFRRETRGGIAKCQLFFQANFWLDTVCGPKWHLS